VQYFKGFSQKHKSNRAIHGHGLISDLSNSRAPIAALIVMAMAISSSAIAQASNRRRSVSPPQAAPGFDLDIRVPGLGKAVLEGAGGQDPRLR
jgi:hypothetical protein